MTETELETMLGLAFLENHPRIEIIQGLARIAQALPDTSMKKVVLNSMQFVYLPETDFIIHYSSTDYIWIALEKFCQQSANRSFASMKTRDFTELKTDMENLIEALENAWRHKQTSAATPAVQLALEWLREAVFGRNLNIAERAVLRGLYNRERELRAS